jgi:large subunit ribosomal protein L9
MNVKLILLEDVEDLGNAGDTVNVAAGFARNYLVPKGLAIKTSPAALRQVESRKGKIEEHRKIEFEKAKTVALKIAELELTIPMQAGDDNQLFGSVTSHLISEEAAKHGVEFESKRIKLEKPIKEIGNYSVEIKLHSEITASLKVWVVKA